MLGLEAKSSAQGIILCVDGSFWLKALQLSRLAEHFGSIGHARALAAKEARLPHKLEEFVPALANIALGPIAKGFCHRGTEQTNAKLRKQSNRGILKGLI